MTNEDVTGDVTDLVTTMEDRDVRTTSTVRSEIRQTPRRELSIHRAVAATSGLSFGRSVSVAIIARTGSIDALDDLYEFVHCFIEHMQPKAEPRIEELDNRVIGIVLKDPSVNS